MPYLLAPMISDDSALIDQASHWDDPLDSGRKLDPSFTPPVLFTVDADVPGRTMPTFFTTPAFVATTRLREDLLAAGADNIDAYPADIRDPETGQAIPGYEFLNIVGMVSCADMERSDSASLGPGIDVVNTIVLDGSRIPDLHIFRLAEDPIQIVVSDQVHDYLVRREYPDLYLERLEVSEPREDLP